MNYYNSTSKQQAHVWHFRPNKSRSKLNDRYADSIMTEPGLYDAIEIHGVRDLNIGSPDGSTCCEIDDIFPQFYSVFVHLKEGGIDCVGDFGSHTMAKRYAKELANKFGFHVVDFQSNQSEVN